MKRRHVLAALAICACAQAAELAEYLVTLAPGADEKTVREVYGRFGIKAIKALADNVYLVTMAHDPGLAAMDKAREGHELVRAVQRNQRYRRY